MVEGTEAIVKGMVDMVAMVVVVVVVMIKPIVVQRKHPLLTYHFGWSLQVPSAFDS
jgi:hypothetical protein